MASARKKQDEKNLKILRELVSLPGNKHCFDCNQRGPTYVNMTIGSFVCTKCSGMLRGLTPPHRVKSISMASFTPEEVELIKTRGNDVCRSTWLALYDQNTDTTNTKDEQQVKDFMVDKYECKRYYHSKGLTNGAVATPPPRPSPVTTTTAVVKPNLNQAQSNGLNGNSGDDFVADFSSADIFSSSQFNNNTVTSTPQTTQPSFANFDNNVIFNSTTASYPSSYDLLVNQVQLTQVPMSRYVMMNRWNMSSPTPTMNGVISNGFSNGFSVNNKAPPPPSEDRYAALKDLDNALKSQQQQQKEQPPQIEWSSNGSGYTSPSPLYGSPGNNGSMYGSPSQSNIMSSFPAQEMSNNISNPFSMNGGMNGSMNGSVNNGMNGTRNPWAVNSNNTVVANNCFTNTNTTSSANPFRDAFAPAPTPAKFNGFNGFQQQPIFPVNHSSHFNKPWTNANPFTLGVSPGAGGTSNNPFL